MSVFQYGYDMVLVQRDKEKELQQLLSRQPEQGEWLYLHTDTLMYRNREMLLPVKPLEGQCWAEAALRMFHNDEDDVLHIAFEKRSTKDVESYVVEVFVPAKGCNWNALIQNADMDSRDQ
jgi:hypothetical protein